MDSPIMIYDADCNLCNGLAGFVKRHNNNIRLLSMQSGNAKEILKKNNMSYSNLNTVLFIKNGEVFTKSGAVLNIIKMFNGLWKILYAFIIVPKYLRNKSYDYVAYRRYKWFGQKSTFIKQ
jgi:predicted DCC family thiol-disulfide oxidoreductase YuxK